MTGSPSPVHPAAAPRPIPAAPELSWLELFYDLVFVAAIVVVSTTFSELAGWSGIVWLALVFSLIWCTWLTTTVMLGVGIVATLWTRTLLLAQMVLVLAVAITSDYRNGDHSTAVAPLFAAVLLTLALLYRTARRSDEKLKEAYRGYGLRCVVAAGVFLVAPAFGWPWWYPIPWLIGILVFMLPLNHAERQLPLRTNHVVHRFGEFTIIMLGEVFVKLGITATSHPLDEVDLYALPLATAVVFGIWWLYFTDVPTMGMSERPGRRLVWVHLHFPMHLGVVATAVALAHTLLPVEGSGAHDGGSINSIQYVVIPVAAILASIGLLGVFGGGDAALARTRLRVFLAATGVLVVSEAVLLGSESYDLQASAFIVTVVLAVTAWWIRRLGAPAGQATAAGSVAEADVGQPTSHPTG